MDKFRTKLTLPQSLLTKGSLEVRRYYLVYSYRLTRLPEST
ncbi:hypothetical protein [Photobacterium damselae]